MTEQEAKVDFLAKGYSEEHWKHYKEFEKGVTEYVEWEKKHPVLATIRRTYGYYNIKIRLFSESRGIINRGLGTMAEEVKKDVQERRDGKCQ